MSIASVELAVVEFVGDVLVNDCGRPPPDHVFRYHLSVPHYCCTDNGVLAIHWTIESQQGAFPTGALKSPCNGLLVTQLTVKYVVCWPAVEFDGGAVIMKDAEWDAQATMLANVADCVARALIRLTCDPQVTDPFGVAVLEETAKRVQFIDTSPIPPGGLCAGVQWRLYAAVPTGEVTS